jgi:hypothetical protein
VTLIVEAGAGVAGAESYNTIAAIAAYAVAHGLTFEITGGTNEAAAEGAARRAATWLDAQYRDRTPGRRTKGRSQGLEWPRCGAYDLQEPPELFAITAIPSEILAAHCEAAIREKAAPGALSPDVTTGKIKKRVKVEGAIETEYAILSPTATSQRPIVTVIDDIMGSLIGLRRPRELLRV